MRPYDQKSTTEEIRARFDNDVTRFSNLETGQLTTLDASFNMELITDCIAALHPDLNAVLDIGCGAGNYTLKLLSKTNPASCTLNDLSAPMLSKAKERLSEVYDGTVILKQGDIRDILLDEEQFDVIMAAAVLHHLRDDEDWETVFSKLYSLLKPGGSIWISDLIRQETEPVQHIVYDERYGEYVASLKDETYKNHVFDYIEKEDSPRSLMYQIRLLEKTGFRKVEILHKNLCFASFGGVK